MFCTGRKSYFSIRTLCCSKNHALFIENEILKVNKNSRGAFLDPIFCIIEAKEKKRIIAYRNTCATNLRLVRFKYVYIVLKKNVNKLV